MIGKYLEYPELLNHSRIIMKINTSSGYKSQDLYLGICSVRPYIINPWSIAESITEDKLPCACRQNSPE